jgi:drug/metabolite transporter (DMT)-like permease
MLYKENPDMRNIKLLLAFGTIYFIWGASFLAASFGLDSFPPYLLMALRYTTAALILLLYSFFSTGKLPGRRSLTVNSIGGVLILVGGSGSVLWAQQFIGSALAAILVSSLPVWFILLDRRQWPLYFKQISIMAGVVLGFAGILLLFGFNHPSPKTPAANIHPVLSIAVLLAGCISFTIGTLFVKYRKVNEPVATNAGIQLLAAGIVALIISASNGEIAQFSLSAVTTKAWLALAYLSLFGSVAGYLSYVWLLSIQPAARVGTFAYVNPVVAVLLGAFVAHENIPTIQIIALLIILCSVLLVNLPDYLKKPAYK